MTGFEQIDLVGWSFAFALVLARTSAAVMLLPGIGEAELPAIIRAGSAVILTNLLLPGIKPSIPAIPPEMIKAGAMMANEVVTGLWLGWLARVMVLGLPIAGQIGAYLLGTSSVLQIDQALGPQTAAISKLFSMAVPVLVLSSGLYAAPIAALESSYRIIPPGRLLPVQMGAESMLTATSNVFILVLRLTSPLLISAIVWHAAMSLVARLAPRVQTYFLGIPAQILGGLLVLSFSISAIIVVWQAAVTESFSLLPAIK